MSRKRSHPAEPPLPCKQPKKFHKERPLGAAKKLLVKRKHVDFPLGEEISNEELAKYTIIEEEIDIYDDKGCHVVSLRHPVKEKPFPSSPEAIQSLKAILDYKPDRISRNKASSGKLVNSFVVGNAFDGIANY